MLNEKERTCIVQRVQQELSSKRFEHVLRVESKAIALAKKYDVDIIACQLAALLHDFTKEWTYEQYAQVVHTYQLDESLLDFGSELLHGPVGACVIECLFGITDDRVKKAISVHTSGDVVMDDVAKVLFIADYIEDGRDFDGVDEARELAQESLDKAVIFKLQHTVAYLANRGIKIYPKTIVAYNAWVTKGEK